MSLRYIPQVGIVIYSNLRSSNKRDYVKHFSAVRGSPVGARSFQRIFRRLLPFGGGKVFEVGEPTQQVAIHSPIEPFLFQQSRPNSNARDRFSSDLHRDRPIIGVARLRPLSQESFTALQPYPQRGWRSLINNQNMRIGSKLRA